MKNRIFCLGLILMFCFVDYSLSQQNTIEADKKSGVFIGLSAGAAHSALINNGNENVSGLENRQMSSFSGSFDIYYMFSEHIGLTTGIRLLSFYSELSLSRYNSAFNFFDSENDNCEYRISATDVSEIQKVNTLNLPVGIMFRLKVNKRTGLFLQPGFCLMFPVNMKYSSKGIFTYKGYYPDYDILLENLPAYGFPSNRSTYSEGELKLRKAGLNAFASAGFDFSIGPDFQIALAGSFYKSISHISDYSNPATFQLSPEVDEINSLMGGSTRSALQSAGLSISFRYRIK